MIIQSATQLKDLIRNMARENHGEPLVLMRNYMMERFLERITLKPLSGQLYPERRNADCCHGWP